MSEQSEYEEKLRLYEREVETVKAINEFIKFLNETKRSTSDNLYKVILTISTVAITVSVPVLGHEKIANLQFLWLLKVAWMFLALSIFFIVAGYLHEDKQLDNVLKQIARREAYTDLEVRMPPERVSPLKLACAAFMVAILALVFFLVSNVGQ